jgi:hypothetical protein
MSGGHGLSRTDSVYAHRVSRSADIAGWDAESLAEFDRRWARGDSQKELAAAFDISPFWVNIVRARRGLPKREFPYRGGRLSVRATRERDPFAELPPSEIFR